MVRFVIISSELGFVCLLVTIRCNTYELSIQSSGALNSTPPATISLPSRPVTLIQDASTLSMALGASYSLSTIKTLRCSG